MTRSDDHDMKVGMGLPGEIKEILTVEEEKSIDEHGRRVVSKSPWSYVSTGLYLTVFVSTCGPMVKVGCDREMAGGRLTLTSDHQLLILTTFGKPAFSVDGWGTSLELPADLARDDLKKSYLTEWLIDAVQEICEAADAPLEKSDDLAVWLASAADRAVRATGL